MHNDRQRLHADLALLAVAAIWGSSFVIQRIVAGHLGYFVFNGLRFILGALVLLPAVGHRWRAVTRTELRGGALAGVLLAIGSALQQAGLQFTTAGKAAFVTGLYVVLVPLFLAIGWRQRPHWMVWAASLLAAVGLFLLSAEGRLSLALGDGLELAGAVMWALHVILIGQLAVRAQALRLSVIQFLVCGLLSTALGLVYEGHTLGVLRTAWWAVAYGGVLSVGTGFTLQVVGQQAAPATDAAILLSMEAVFAALAGWVFLGESLTPRQALGGGLMLTGMLLAQLPSAVAARGRRLERRDRLESRVELEPNS
jgi:drug/metabolite transporter (DMT)-like permease